MREEILRLESVSREIGGSLYLDDVNLHILKGEVVGFIASEAKGREELFQLLCQNVPMARGRVYVGGRLVNSFAHSDMSYNKVYIVGRKSGLIEDLTVADNIFVMRRGFRKYLINRSVLGGQVRRLLEDFGICIDPDLPVRRLKPFERCVAELLRAQLMGSLLVVLNDLNNFLNLEDVRKIQEVMHRFCSLGTAFLYVGNHHEDVFKVSDRAILFAGGRIKKVFYQDEMDDQHMAPYITSFGLSVRKVRPPEKKLVLEFDRVYARQLQGFCLKVYQGECVALLDEDLSSTREIVELMTGGMEASGGGIRLDGRPYTPAMSRRYLSHGVALIEDNPVQTMVFKDLSYLENLTFLLDRKLGRSILRRRYIRSVMEEYGPLIGRDIYLRDVSLAARKSLYQLIYYRIHLYGPRLAICVSPFSYGDMETRNQILDLIQDLKNKGIAVVLLLVNISDSLKVADRLLVLNQGSIIREYDESGFYLVRR